MKHKTGIITALAVVCVAGSAEAEMVALDQIANASLEPLTTEILNPPFDNAGVGLTDYSAAWPERPTVNSFDPSYVLAGEGQTRVLQPMIESLDPSYVLAGEGQTRVLTMAAVAGWNWQDVSPATASAGDGEVTDYWAVWPEQPTLGSIDQSLDVAGEGQTRVLMMAAAGWNGWSMPQFDIPSEAMQITNSKFDWSSISMMHTRL